MGYRDTVKEQTNLVWNGVQSKWKEKIWGKTKDSGFKLTYLRESGHLLRQGTQEEEQVSSEDESALKHWAERM